METPVPSKRRLRKTTRIIGIFVVLVALIAVLIFAQGRFTDEHYCVYQSIHDATNIVEACATYKRLSAEGQFPKRLEDRPLDWKCRRTRLFTRRPLRRRLGKSLPLRSRSRARVSGRPRGGAMTDVRLDALATLDRPAIWHAARRSPPGTNWSGGGSWTCRSWASGGRTWTTTRCGSWPTRRSPRPSRSMRGLRAAGRPVALRVWRHRSTRDLRHDRRRDGRRASPAVLPRDPARALRPRRGAARRRRDDPRRPPGDREAVRRRPGAARRAERRAPRRPTQDKIFRSTTSWGRRPVAGHRSYLRFANAIFEPLWNRDHVSSVQITMARASASRTAAVFYDSVGALRDVVQNHLLEVLSLVVDGAAGR